MKLRLLAIATLLAFLSPARADVVTWQLQNVGFDDGGQATGWFNVDNVTHTFLDWSISVNGGNTTVFPNALYDPHQTGAPVASRDWKRPFEDPIALPRG